MKPFRLEMSAFGSYADLEVVDFTSVDHGIFLITGDTGAGKTTIFDGMMYALYDETSGGRRDGAMMRSQYAKAEQETYVRFDFLYRGERYSILRNPEYYRPGKRRMGDGSPRLVKETTSVELTLPDGSVYQGKKRDVDRKIQEIIGLDAEQFRQVAMIAQGDFLKLLHAESRERKLIFSRIFHTRIYRNIQESLKAKAKEFSDAIEENTALCRRDMELVICGEESPYASSWEAQKVSAEFSMEETMDLLEKITEEDRMGLKKLETDKNSVKNGRLLLEELMRREQQLFQSQRQMQENEEQIQILQQWILEQTQIQKTAEDTKDAYARQVQEQEPPLSASITRLSDSLDRYDTLKQRQKEEKQGGKLLQQITKDQEQNRKQKERNQKKSQEVQQALDKLQDLPLRKLEGEHELQMANSQRLQLMEFQQNLMALENWKQEQTRRQQQYEQTQKKALLAGEQYTKLYQAFFQEQAGILAQDLEDGKPCPVCGSIHHPDKSVLSSDAPTQAQVEQSKQVREQAEQRREQAYVQFQEIRQKVLSKQQILTDQGRTLLNLKSFQPDETGAERVKKQVDTVDKSIEKWRKAVDKIRQLEEKQSQYQTMHLQLEEELDILQKTSNDLEKTSQSATVSLGVIRRELLLLGEQLAFSEEGQARQELKNLQRALKQLRDALQKAETDCNRRASAIQGKTGERKAREEQRVKLEREVSKGKKAYENQLAALLESCPQFPLSESGEQLKVWNQKEKRLEKAYMHAFTRTQNNKSALDRLMSRQKNQKEIQHQYLLYQDLSRTANGTLVGSIKVDFETYVQRQYFKQIIAAANRRLVRMNHQQFILQCRDLDKLGTQGQVGLDLDVYHLVNDSLRDVKTLSGGESFMAALAMALGLADIIQNEAGAIRLDTMFVDEGFGSLDDESRSQAVEVLLELADNQRLVGIISHVNELKEQIDQKLIVTKNNQGSHIRWSQE